MSKVLSKISILLPLRDFLYILQLEEYETVAFLKQVSRRLFRRKFEVRDSLDLTARVKLIAVATVMLLVVLLWCLYTFSVPVFLIVLLLTPFVTPLFIAVANLLIIPIARFLKLRVLTKATRYFAKEYPNTKVIAITGSYGKTTTKYLLQALLEHTFKTALVPENINTSLGIADYILKREISPKTEYLIVEIGAYRRGDVAECARIVQPDISILTALGDQHLDRFGGFSNLVNGKYEIFAHAKPEAKKFTTKQVVDVLQAEHLSTDGVTVVENVDGNIMTLAVAVAKDLQVQDSFVEHTLESFVLPNRRNDLYELNGVQIIDNSYNISLQTAFYALQKAKEMAVQKNKKLVVATAGIAERDSEKETVHKEFAERLSEIADRVIVLPSCYKKLLTPYLSIPVTETERLLTVQQQPEKFVSGDIEILLMFPELTDLSY